MLCRRMDIKRTHPSGITDLTKGPALVLDLRLFIAQATFAGLLCNLWKLDQSCMLARIQIVGELNGRTKFTEVLLGLRPWHIEIGHSKDVHSGF